MRTQALGRNGIPPKNKEDKNNKIVTHIC
jgi:hypothetical protein